MTFFQIYFIVAAAILLVKFFHSIFTLKRLKTFANAKTDEDKYYKNMDLSLKRASSVGQYIIYTQNNYQKDLYKLLTISGKGSSEPIKTNGKEDFSKSRRVELKIAFKDQNLANALKR